MDNVNGAHGFRGHRIVCLDIVQYINGQCPHFSLRESPWIKSRESMDILQGDGGQYPMSPCKLASLSGLPGLCLEYPWTLSRLCTKSMDIVRICPGRQWRMPTESIDIVQSEWAP